MPFRMRFLLGTCFAVALWGAGWPGWGWLGWVAPALFFLSLDGIGPGRGVFLGGVFGFLFFLVELSPTLSLWPFLGGLSIPAWLLLSLYGTVFFALLGGLVGGRSSPLLWAGAWALLEAARGVGPLGFSFGALPGALVGQPFLAAAAWGGATLLSLGMAWTSACLAARRRWPLLAPLGPGFLALLAALAPLPAPEAEFSVSLVQTNVNQIEKLDRANLKALLARYESLLSSISAQVDLVVLPENVLPAYLRAEPELATPFLDTAGRLSARLLVGTGELRAGRVYNSVLLISPSQEIAGVYDMVHLVPFGEYLPGRKLWEALGLGPLLDRLLPIDITPGEGVRPLGEIGTLICFETQFSSLARSLTAQGAKVLVALTNDAWFGRTRFLWEHFTLGALRAAECGRAFLQAAQTGITGAVGPRGELLARLPPWEAGVLTLNVPLFHHETLWVKTGPWPSLGLAGLLLILGLRKKRPRPKAGPGGNASLKDRP